jgi:anaerobic magnesium-protoporphyrin IX monomethyl ester cyclase
MSLKVCFVVYDNGSYDNIFPMGIGALAAIVKEKGHDIKIWHQDIHHYEDEELTPYLDKHKFDIVILSLIGGYYQYQKMLGISKAINASKHRPFYAMGGYGPTPEPKYFLDKSGCDVVCMGEGETTISKLLESVEKKLPLKDVPGVAWLENGELKTTQRAPLINDLSALPRIPYELFPMNIYRMMRSPKCSITDFCFPLMTARGCTFKCTFCYRMDPGYRKRDPEELLDEVEMLHKTYGITRFSFQDDLLMASVEHTENVCKAMLKRNLPITWDCMGRLNYCSKELLQLMKDAGCVFIIYGIESMDQKVLNNMKKGLRPEIIIRGIEQTFEVGISPGFNFIYGNRGDSRKTLEKAVDFLIKYDDFSEKRTIRPVTPYPGSPLYYDAIESGLLDKERPVADFYENKHLNSDLLCCNFTEQTDKEFYETLKWANKKLMKNYYEKSSASTQNQIDHLYDNLDASFRGFRHQGGKSDGSVSAEESFRKNGKKKPKLVNWENTLNKDADADRFLQNSFNTESQEKSIQSYYDYLERKKARLKEKNASKIPAQTASEKDVASKNILNIDPKSKGFAVKVD